MTLLKLARMGHPVLRGEAAPVSDPRDPEIGRLAADMIETMIDADGVGLAAPQVYQPLRVIVFRLPADRLTDDEAPEPAAPVVLVNPVLEPVGYDMALGLEGCLSIPDLRGVVPRFMTVDFRGVDLNGSPVSGRATGFKARVLQHEVDHLDGILFPERMPDLRSLAFNSEVHHLLNDMGAPD